MIRQVPEETFQTGGRRMGVSGGPADYEIVSTKLLWFTLINKVP